MLDKRVTAKLAQESSTMFTTGFVSSSTFSSITGSVRVAKPKWMSNSSPTFPMKENASDEAERATVQKSTKDEDMSSIDVFCVIM
jgi:hypothetical protein